MRVVLSTAPDQEAGERIGRTLVEEGLAACVSLVPNITSIYRWKGAVERATEVLLVLKTKSSLWPELARRLQAIHPYDVPECVALEPREVASSYLAWLLAECEGSPS